VGSTPSKIAQLIEAFFDQLKGTPGNQAMCFGLGKVDGRAITTTACLPPGIYKNLVINEVH